MRRLPASVGYVLPIMACLGSTFHEPLLAVVVDRVGPPPEEESENVLAGEPDRPRKVCELLAACIEEGLIEPGALDRGVETYQWVHDKIQETAFTLLSDEDIQALKFRMGIVLLEGLGEHDLDRYIFTVVDLLSAEASDQQSFEDPVEIAKLYLRAGVKTVENSAFDQAGGYLARGIDLLPAGHWNTNSDLSLELFSVAAQADFCSGNFDRMSTYCDEVVRQDSITLVDKRRVYNAIIDAKCCECTVLAHDICREILTMVGVYFPRFAVTFHVICGMVNLKGTLKKATDLPSLLSDVPDMDDEMKLWTMVLLDKFATYAYLSKSPLLPLAIFKGFHMSLTDGVTFISPVMFSLVGLSLAAFVQDYKGGADFADEAVAMLKRVKGSRQVEARVLMVIHGFVLHWQRPIQLSTKPLLTAYEGGMAIGDTESASWSAIMYIEFTLRSGGVLDDVLADCVFYGEQMRDVKQLNSLDTLCQLWQALLHLTGANPFNGKLSGDVANPGIALRHEHFFATHYRWQMYVAFVLGEYELVYDTIIKTKQHKHFYEEILPGTLGICHLYAYNGLAMISLFRDKKQRKFLRLAKKFTSKIHGFALAGVRLASSLTSTAVYSELAH
jgi:predicted ATPase